MTIELLRELVFTVNNYDGSVQSTNKLRDLVCFISDTEPYKSDPIYREVLFIAAQKMRTFGYNVQNGLSINNATLSDSSDIYHQAIQNYYISKVYKNNLLDKRQKEIVDLFMGLGVKRLIVSAPTSFGKTFLLRELLYLNRDRYKNILLVFPTVALLTENTFEIRNFIDNLNLDYNIVNNVYSKIDPNSKNIYILTPERTLKLLSDYENLNIDFFFFDEVYKIDEDFCKEDSEDEEVNNVYNSKNNRAKAFRIALYILSKAVKEYYIAGPYLNLNNVRSGFKKYLSVNHISTKQIEFEPTLKIEIDAWNKNGEEFHPVLGKRKVKFNYEKGNITTHRRICALIKYIEKNNLGQVIFYCSKPMYSMKYAQEIIDISQQCENLVQRKYEHFIEHLKKRYGIKYRINDKLINSSDYWSLIKILSAGYGVHHGKFPKYIQKQILKMFNDGDIKYLFCTSTIIEGVNTNAKNVVILNNSVGAQPMTSFALKNIKGRAGRYYHNFIGRVFYTSKKQREIEYKNDMKLNFSIYDDLNLLNIDIDNSEIQDLSEVNREIKVTRENKFNKENLPDSVFTKNRLYPRDIQEKYLTYLLDNENFSLFFSIIGQSVSLQTFLNGRMMNKILDSFYDIGIIDEPTKNMYHGVISNYSINRFEGLMRYQMKNNLRGQLEVLDKIYLKVFEQIKNIIEYEIPKLLCLFESIYKQAGRLKGYNMDSFDLSLIIRFFELGVKTPLGIYLVEYGFPIDAIRDIEKIMPTLNQMEIEDSIQFVINNRKKLQYVLDEYERELLTLALGVNS